MKNPGIYKIQSKINPTRIYIGSAINFRHRWNCHLSDLRLNKHHSIKLQRHYNLCGESDLVFIIIEPCLPIFLITREQFYIDTLKPYFNINKVAGSVLGLKHSDELKKITSVRSKLLWQNPEYRNKQIKSHIGKPSGSKGFKHSKETIERLSEAKKGKPNGCLGTKRSEESKQKMKDNHKGMSGKNHSEETKLNMKLAWVKRKLNKSA